VPTYQPRLRFLRDFKSLSAEQEAAWEKALDLFIACLRRGRFEPSLRVKRVQGYPGVWEMTWPPTGAPPSNTAKRYAQVSNTSSGGASAHTTFFAGRKTRSAGEP
jgi:hypothetical protein